MATMKFYNVDTAPTPASPEGVYYVKDADHPNRINTYVVSNGAVKRQEDSREKITQLEREITDKTIASVPSIANSSVVASTGVIAIAGYYRVYSLDVTGYKSLTAQFITSSQDRGYAFFDADENYISGEVSSGELPFVVRTIDIPDNAVTFKNTISNNSSSATPESYRFDFTGVILHGALSRVVLIADKLNGRINTLDDQV